MQEEKRERCISKFRVFCCFVLRTETTENKLCKELVVLVSFVLSKFATTQRCNHAHIFTGQHFNENAENHIPSAPNLTTVASFKMDNFSFLNFLWKSSRFLGVKLNESPLDFRKKC